MQNIQTEMYAYKMFFQIHITIYTELLKPKAHLSNSLQNYSIYGI